ncbi:nucleotide exchange factor GrpE [Arenibaculum pallidiluteum]|uniref:nucleotide exchange factor GrpE n=1 Tax=Arenibaculum pallidiluteum TaxID=2812559 RepID=UPI001A96ACD8|nr:nucleotide exchange factor GrpE [Arenibaculum pallidiluteum]
MHAEENKNGAGTEAPHPDEATQAAPDPQVESAPADEAVRLKEQVSQLKDQLLRALAETENVRRRAERDREEASKFAVGKFARDMVSVADNLRRALEAVLPEQRSADSALENLMVGIEATERQLSAALERAGIQRMEALGQPFDPNFHQVMFEVENSGKPGGTIVQVLQDGYTISGRLLREAMVGVAKRDGSEAPGHLDTHA